MPAVYGMELAPLPRGQRPDDGVLRDCLPLGEARLTFSDDCIHAAKIYLYLVHHFLKGRASREDPFRRLASWRENSQSEHDQPLPTLLASIAGATRFARSQASFQVFYCSEVGEIQMFQNFAGAPFFRSPGMAGELLHTQSLC